jgi:hypothetical protein
MTDFFAPALEQWRIQFLTKVSEDLDLPLDELLYRYKDLTVPKKAKKVPDVLTDPCPIKTSKGDVCKHSCVPGQGTCKMHGRPKVEKPPKPPKKTKKKKLVPEHNHRPFEVPTEPCVLCSTHGDIFNPSAASSDFMSLNLEQRLLSIMNQM